MKLSIVIPVYNEEKTLKKIITKVKNCKLPKGVSREIIVVDDHSSDQSLGILKKIKGVKTFVHKVNKGKGASVRTGFSKTSGDIILIQDADLEYTPRDYPKLLKPIVEDGEKVVYGTRLKNYRLRIFGKQHTPLVAHFIGNKFLSLLTSLLFGYSVTDMETCYKVITREVLDSLKLKSNRFEFEPEITAKILKKGFKIVEVPIKVNPRGYNEGKKITWKDGFVAVWTLAKYRLID